MPHPPEPDDETLVARCRSGDAGGWNALVHRYQRLVYTIARRSGLDEPSAADLCQTVFMRLLQHLPRIDAPAGLQAWIITTAQREAWLQRRRAARSVSMNRPAGHGDEDTEWLPADDSPGPDEIVAHWQQMARVRRAFERLDERCRELLQALFGSEAVGYDELARRLGVPVGSIGPTRARCLAKLRRMVE